MTQENTKLAKPNTKLIKKLNVEAVLAANTQSVMKRANELAEASKKYETETLARSNKELYGILGQVYDLFMEAYKDIPTLKQTVNEMKEVLGKRNVKVQSNSPALTVFVRYVFNSDRKRAYNYTRTLMAVVKDKKESQSVADFIEAKGGVEECKKNFAKKPETLAKEEALKEAATQVVSTLESMRAVETVTLPNSSVYLKDGCEYAFVIARVGANNKLELLRAVPATTKAMEGCAIKELAKEVIEKRNAANDASKVVQKQEASALAVSTMSVKQLEAA
jgi:hypothetical protein